MSWLLVVVALWFAGACLCLATGRRSELACWLGPATVLIGGGLFLVRAVPLLIRGQTLSLPMVWHVPLGSAHLGIDPLSAVFAIVIVAVSMFASVYGGSYLRHYADRKRLGVSWFFYILLTASMLGVVVARNGVLFLVCWECMSLASFFLVMFESEKESVRRAGWTYLVAMHLGTAFLLAMFLLLGRGAGSLDFERFSASPAMADVVFLLAVIGFGTKAGFIPMHVWLPEAHPAAPSHVSAVMSGVMIKTGIYGLLRTLTFLGEPPAWWGWTLLGVGVVSGILGVLFALAQHDLKRLLAYHSVENIGIIAMGIGTGLLGVSYGNPTMAALGFAGGLLHVVNHAVFKSLLFLGAGSVLHATGTLEIDRLGGLIKRMPVTAGAFLIGAAAISGLPPLNGFISELLIYLGAAGALDNPPVAADALWPLLGVLVLGALGLVGGLAAACFTKAFGVVFLGEPRSAEAAGTHESNAAMRWPMVLLAGACVAIGLAAPPVVRTLHPAVVSLVPVAWQPNVSAAFSPGIAPLTAVVFGSYILLGLIVLFGGLRRKLLTGRRVEQAVTWDCGYVEPTPRMQYTASSFARPLTSLLRLLLQPADEIEAPSGLFPSRARLHTHTPDVFRRRIYRPLFLGVAWAALRFRWLQKGRIQLYVLYIALTLLLLLVWKLG